MTPGRQWVRGTTWQWLLAATLLWCPRFAATNPAFLLTFPAVIEAGSTATLCASLLQPNETLRMSVLLVRDAESVLLFEWRTDAAFFYCRRFQAPAVQEESIQSIRVKVEGVTFRLVEESKVLFRPVFPITFIQPDKPVYIPGQMVQFRVVSMDSRFVPVNQLYDSVGLEDVNGNRISEWFNVSSNGRILQLSHPLSSEAAVGTYRLAVSVGQQRTEESFTVLEYVLPRFEVRVNAPAEVNAVEPQVHIRVCGKYTYGQPVAGKAELQLCRSPYPWLLESMDRQCLNKSVQLDKSGCTSSDFAMTFFLHLLKGYQDSLSFTTQVEEQGTGVVLPGAADITMNYLVGRVSFVDTPDTYTPGLAIKGKVQLVYYNDTPIADRLVYLYKGLWDPSQLLLNLTTDQQGMAHFSVNLGNQSDAEVQLRASWYSPSAPSPPYQPQTAFYQDGMHTVSLANADTMPLSFVAVEKMAKPLPCGRVVPMTVRYMIVGETAQNKPLDLVYLILSKGAIVKSGQVKIAWPSTSHEGQVSFKLEVVPELAPVVQVLAYTVLPSGTIIAASMDFPTEKCFKHRVSLAFSPTNAVPGEHGTLNVMAEPGALCGLSAVDRSVLLLAPGKRLDADKIYSLLPVQQGTYIPYAVEDPVPCLQVRAKRFVRVQEEWGALDVFQRVGLKLATNLMARMPTCLMYKGRSYYSYYFKPMAFAAAEVARLDTAPKSAPEQGPLETVRTWFPEMWLWDLVEVGVSGSTLVPVTVPDTITTWETDAFCLSATGLGLAPPTELTVFQSFFLDVTLPYSIVRGERLQLKATVFNYLTRCIVVRVTAPSSSGYSLAPCANCQYSSCLCASETQTFKWLLQGSALGVVNVSVSAEALAATCNGKVVTAPDRGHTDTVVRPLLIKAEGMVRRERYNWLLCPNRTSIGQDVVLQPPANMVVGSALVSVSVLGEVLGRALQNMGDLLAVPYGCGEQNMATLSSDIYIMLYLKSTGQLTPAILQKADNLLKTGYQTQLNYKNSNGSYSTFAGGPGNNWLTAFVMKSFAKAQEWVYIDPRNIEDAVSWLLTTQTADGCFQTVGKLYHSELKGGVYDDVTLTAYIAVAFLESKISNPALNLSLACLRSDTTYLSSTYTAALMAYMFSLARDEPKRAQLLAHLNRVASADGTSLYWSQSSSASLSVEMSSYVLLAVLTGSPLSATDLGYGRRIVAWLVKQQNAFGGFWSTQDTVVALQALSVYSTLVQNAEGGGSSSTVTVWSPSGQREIFAVNASNKLLYQERQLQDVRGTYRIVVQGTRCVSVQLTLRYNVPTPPPAVNTVFSVIPTVKSVCVPKETVTLNLRVRYDGLRPVTNMVVLEIKLLSGFVLTPSSLKELRGSAMVELVTSEEGSVVLYLTELKAKSPVSYTLKLQQELTVDNLKPAVITVYDYYQTSDHTTVMYASGCK